MVNQKQSIIERIEIIRKYYKYSQGNFEQKMQWSNGYINTSLKRKSNVSGDILQTILGKFPKVNPKWLLTGEGNMLRNQNSDEKNQIYQTNNIDEGIPLVPTSAIAGVFRGEIAIREVECQRYIVPPFRDAHYLITVRGDSMAPKYLSGDIVACKKVPLNDIFFQWNKAYILDTNQGIILKRLAKHKDLNYLTCVSDNKNYASFDLHIKDNIYSISIVLGIIRLD